MTRLGLAAFAGLASLIAFAPLVGLAQDTAVPQAGQPSIVTQPLPPPDAQAPGATPAPNPAQPPAGAPPSANVPPANAQANAAPAVPSYSPAQLDQMLAPIAIYPDNLLTNILMASTYPVQVVEAERWLQKPANARLKGDALVQALDPMPWDPSVKSLVPFPMVLKQMNDQLEWTEQLGTAFANQQADVMERVQALRQKCDANGKLANVPKLHVVHQGPNIVIEPAEPAVVYVPVYNPAVIYGPWPYVEYPPVFFTPGVAFYAGPIGVDIGFSVGFGIVGPFWGWGVPVWGEHHVFINNVAYTHISYNHVGVSSTVFSHSGAVGRFSAAHGVAGAGSRGALHAAAASHATGRFSSAHSRSFASGTRQAHAGMSARPGGARPGGARPGGFGRGASSHAASRNFAGAGHRASFAGGSHYATGHAARSRGAAGHGSPGGRGGNHHR